MNGGRRQWLQRALAAWAAGGAVRVSSAGEVEDAVADRREGAVPAAIADAGADAIRRGRTLQFPRDHGAHPGAQIEWWYLTGYLAPGAAAAASGPVTTPSHGFQVTFFRARTGLAEQLPGRFAPRQLLFAHAALTELAQPDVAASHHHAQRIARWDGRTAVPMAQASLQDTDVALERWVLRRDAGGGYVAKVSGDGAAGGFALALQLAPAQPLLLQGDRGFSRKGPLEQQASHYYSVPQLKAGGSLRSGSRTLAVHGAAWLDHEWSDSLLPPEAEGWDWIGMNLFDGSALTAFRLRRSSATGPAAQAQAQAPAVWAGGSFRPAGGAVRAFADQEVRFTAGRTWRSQATGATYPVAWQVQTPIGAFTVRSLLDAQELDGSASTGTVYWEGLAELLDASGRRVGLGYLEMTGYAGRLRLSRAGGDESGVVTAA